MDSNHKLHVMNSRGQIRWTRSKRSLDDDKPFRSDQDSLDDFETRKDIGTRNSYAHPVVDGNGQLWVFTREGFGDEYWRTSTGYAGDWASADLSEPTRLTEFGGVVYMRNKPHVDSEGSLTYRGDVFFSYGAKDQGAPGSISGTTLVRYRSDGDIVRFAPDIEIGIPFDAVISPLTSVPIHWHPRYPILIGYLAGRDDDGEPYGNIALLRADSPVANGVSPPGGP